MLPLIFFSETERRVCVCIYLEVINVEMDGRTKNQVPTIGEVYFSNVHLKIQFLFKFQSTSSDLEVPAFFCEFLVLFMGFESSSMAPSNSKSFRLEGCQTGGRHQFALLQRFDLGLKLQASDVKS